MGRRGSPRHVTRQRDRHTWQPPGPRARNATWRRPIGRGKKKRKTRSFSRAWSGDEASKNWH
jgi:hypothetical protein